MVDQAKPITPEDFVTRWPLYTVAQIDDFEPPSKVSLHCASAKCGKETTWELKKKSGEWLDSARQSFNWAYYMCAYCDGPYLLIFYRTFGQAIRKRTLSQGMVEDNVSPKVVKMGQFPAPSVDVPKKLERNLGVDGTALYKKALVNRSQGYGLGAVTYIRRVVEDKTNELIEAAAQLAESYGVDPKIVGNVRKAATERTTYDQKLNIAATVLPEVLKVEGVNPLAELYGLVSQGVHELTEEECIAVADETEAVFEYLFTNLRAAKEARHGFVEKVKKLAERRHKGTVEREATGELVAAPPQIVE